MAIELTDQEKERIRAGEIFRLEARKTLELDQPSQPTGRLHGISTFLNSTFGNFLCTAVAIPIFIWMFSAVQGHYDKQRTRDKLIYRIDTEIAYRLQSQWHSLQASANEGSVGAFVKLLDAESSAFPEFKDRPTAGLMVELSKLIPKNDAMKIDKARSALINRIEKDELEKALNIRNWIDP